MKKIILTVAAVFAFGFANAQDGQFKVGAHVGLPMGDIKDGSSLNLGADVAYLWNVTDKFKAGTTTGYSSYLGKTVKEDVNFGGFGSFGSIENKTDASGFIPVAATAQYSLSDKFFVGTDLGYAIYVGKGEGDGGVYYQPKFGYQTEKIELYAGYKGISVDGATFSSLNLGFNYKF
ncbi:hypothetical protein HNP99_001647 [Flavobacterium sp. 28A]|uniref:hypothetical protein n=1 Tax=Flavobacterium sp. 28A TaxID=2735895 RepID=UPI001570E4AB|nr:hypothetical protein [Flavobacterium sp. 28A]NRT15300.1 hypothetical protein [Flavobacterium sp. 28A]